MQIAGELRLCGDWAPKMCRVETCFEENLLVNIEAPVIPEGKGCHLKPLPKAGPSLLNHSLPKTNKQAIAVLANNHLFDYSTQGYISTLQQIQQNGWVSVGAGMTRSLSREPLIFEWDQKRVAIIARCETQFGVSQRTKPGVAEFSLDVFNQIKNLKKSVDLVIISIHSAAELLPWPSPRRQDEYRMYIDSGADIVHGHHAHVPNGWEEYEGGFIFYGLGNFCVDPKDWSWHPNGLWSFSPVLEIRKNAIQATYQTLVIGQNEDGVYIRPSNSEESKQHSEYLEMCNRPLHDRKLLEGLWQEASLSMFNQYYAHFLSLKKRCSSDRLSRIKERAALLSHIFRPNARKRAAKDRHLMYYHLFACDSHRDAISTALGLLGGELEDLRSAETLSMLKGVSFC